MNLQNKLSLWIIPFCFILSLSSCAKIFKGSGDIKVVKDPDAPKTTQPGNGNSPGNGNNPGNGGGVSPGQPGGPGWGGPGWGGSPGGPGNGFDPQKPGDGMGRDGQLLQDEFYDVDLGVKFRCLAKSCYMKKYLEKDNQGNIARFGVKVFSDRGMNSSQEFFTFERIFSLNQQQLGQVKEEELLPLLQNMYPGKQWEASTKMNNVPGLYTQFQSSSLHEELLFSVDDQKGLTKIHFSIANGQTDDAYLGYFILFSIQVDLQAPTLKNIQFGKNTYTSGETLSVHMQAQDDLTGIDPQWSYHEYPERKLVDIEPRNMLSWLGYVENHNQNTYSLAYAFPLMLQGTERLWITQQSSDIYTYNMQVPANAVMGTVAMGGVRLRDRYGHETRVSLDNGNSYARKYKHISGRADPAFLNQNAAVASISNSRSEDKTPPQLLQATFTPAEIRKPEDKLCLLVNYQDASLLRRLGLEFSVNGTKLSPPTNCLSETAAAWTASPGRFEVCYQMKSCFDSTGKSLLPLNTKIELSQAALYDEAGNRAEVKSSSLLPEFFVR